MKQKGFTSKLHELKKLGYLIMGICGGYQILGKSIIDMNIEGNSIGEYQGLGFLPIRTEFKSYDKITRQIKAEIIGFPPFNGQQIDGYEIHMGRINRDSDAIPLLKIKNNLEQIQFTFIGAINKQKTVFGSLIHGFWDNDKFREQFIDYLFFRKNIKKKPNKNIRYQEIIEKNIQKITKVVQENLDIKEIMKLLSI